MWSIVLRHCPELDGAEMATGVQCQGIQMLLQASGLGSACPRPFSCSIVTG